jgi:hypothetical protein
MTRALTSTIASLAVAFLLALALGGTAMAQSPTVMTDQSDYAPGTIVTITGSGWQPGETVTLSFVESPLIDMHPDLYATADANGNIFNNQFSPDSHDVDITFTLTATGGTSGLQAQTTFTDAITLDSVTVGSQVGIVTTGIAGSASYAVCVSYHGSNSTIAFSVISGLPVGVTPSFSANNINNPPVCPTTATTLTLTATAAVAAGTYTFTVQATGGGTVTSTGTLLVAGSASKLVFTSAPVTVTAGVCSSALTVQSRDSSGNPSNVSSTETLTPSATPPGGASFYTDNTCTAVVTGSNLTIPSGSNSASFFFKDTTPGSVQITVTGTGAFTANGANAATQTQTVNAATARRGQTIVATLSLNDRYTMLALR